MKKHTIIFTILIIILSSISVFMFTSLTLGGLVVSYDSNSTPQAYDMLRTKWRTKNRGTVLPPSCRYSPWLSNDKFEDEFDIYLKLNDSGKSSVNQQK
jgi:hypothetical protein